MPPPFSGFRRVVTGVKLYLPLAFIGGSWLIREHRVAPSSVAQAVFIAAVYQLWSSWRHRRHVSSADQVIEEVRGA